MNKDLKKYRVVTELKWFERTILISYKSYALTNIENGTEPATSSYRFDPITTWASKDEYLIDFLKKIAK